MDFDVTLGDAKCVPVSLTDDQVDCRPPNIAPNRTVNDSHCQDNAFYINVRLFVKYIKCNSISLTVTIVCILFLTVKYVPTFLYCLFFCH